MQNADRYAGRAVDPNFARARWSMEAGPQLPDDEMSGLRATHASLEAAPRSTLDAMMRP